MTKPLLQVGMFEIRLSSGGGKAGKGCNKTGTVQVCQPFNLTHYLLLKEFRYVVGKPGSLRTAFQRATQYAEKIKPIPV